MIAISSDIHLKHKCTLCGQNVEFWMLNLLVHKVTAGLLILISVPSKSKFFITLFLISHSVLNNNANHSNGMTYNWRWTRHLIYKDEMVFFFFFFLCLFVPYTNPHFWTDLNRTLHTSPPSSGAGRTVQYLSVFNFFGQEPLQNPEHNMAVGPRVIATALYPWSSRRHLRHESSVK
jgi:hypothetical protein